MFNNRMLAVAAVLALAVPALGAAAPMVVTTATTEQLVEGHTVFTVIESSGGGDVNGTTTFAAAVAVLVREYNSENRNVRFPGVLWFNDQYLVNPQNQKQDAAEFRYPCGGAVMAVNQGDPDPRLILASAHVSNGGSPTGVRTDRFDPANGAVLSDETPENYTMVNASIDAANPTGSTFTSDAVIDAAAGVSYEETYTIIDPNDHQWVIDVYRAFARTVGSNGLSDPVYQYRIWVVNIMGYPVFIPDDGELSCFPFYDTSLSAIGDATKDLDCALPNPQPPGLGLSGRDDPCAGYQEPSRNGGAYCYSGGPVPPGGCDAAPVRLYNAVLYFKLHHLTDPGDARTHHANATDTNGCHVGTEWACPGGDDNAEGNSHPFHPATHTTSDTGPCVADSAYSNQESANGGFTTNHGGSTKVGAPNANGSYSHAPCDNAHATRNIDIYFSGNSRPARPLVAKEGIPQDTQGSDAPFHDTPKAQGYTH